MTKPVHVRIAEDGIDAALSGTFASTNPITALVEYQGAGT